MKMINKALVVVAPIEAETKNKYENNRILTPVEPLSLATLLQREGITVKLLDMGLYRDNKYDKLKDVLTEFQPDMVVLGFPLLTFNFDEWDGGRTFKIVKEVNNSAYTVFSGAQVCNFPEKTLENQDIDFIVIGEYEFTILDIINAVNNKLSLTEVKGLGFRENGVSVISGEYQITDLTKLPVPDFSLLEFDKYFQYPERGKIRYPEKSEQWIDLQFSRSCPYNCNFCNVRFLRKEKYRRKGNWQILQEISEVVKNGIREIHIIDDYFASTREDVLEFADMLLKNNIRINWFVAQGFPLHVLDYDVLRSLKEAGMYRLIAPFESASNRVLREIIGKRLTVEHSEHIVESCKLLDIELVGLFVIGNPGERLQEIRDTVNFARSHDIDYSVFSIATPQIGTRLMNTVEKLNLMPEGYSKVQKYVKRTTALFEAEDFTAYDLEKIRCIEWININFGSVEKRKKYAKMVGIDDQSLEKQISGNRRYFNQKYGYVENA